MGFYAVKEDEKKEEKTFLIKCPKCEEVMRRSGVLGDDLLHTLNRETGTFHTQMKVFGSPVYRCKGCQVMVVVLVDPSFREGYIQR